MTLNHNKLNTVGGVPVFTIEGAVNAYKAFAARCYANLTMESSVALADEAAKLHDMGISWDDIETIENQAIA